MQTMLADRGTIINSIQKLNTYKFTKNSTKTSPLMLSLTEFLKNFCSFALWKLKSITNTTHTSQNGQGDMAVFYNFMDVPVTLTYFNKQLRFLIKLKIFSQITLFKFCKRLRVIRAGTFHTFKHDST